MRRRSNLDNDRTDQDLHERPTCRNDFKRPSRLRTPLILANGTSLQISVVIAIWLCRRICMEAEVLARTSYAVGRTVSDVAFCYGAACSTALKWPRWLALNWAVKYAERIHTVSR
jgi:hypothetical protein